MNPKKTAAERLALVVRVLSVPPLIVTLFVAVLAVFRPGVFRNGAEIAVTLLSLALLPGAAYPISVLLPSLRARGREGQRSLAFALSLAGYLIAWLYGVFFSRNVELIRLYSIYLLSVALLLVCNKLLHIRASGHASSITGPIVLSCLYFGWPGIALGSGLWALIFWGSVRSRRHTPAQFLLGSATCAAACILLWLLIQ